MRKVDSVKGITLIALVITIIVMLILVGVTLNVVLNGNLIGNTQDAKNKQALERDKELLYTAALGCMENGVVKFDGVNGLNNNLPDGFSTTDKIGKYTKGNNIFYVKANGEVTGRETSTYLAAEDLELEPGVELIPKENLTGDFKKAADEGKILAVLKERIDNEDVIAVVPTGFTVSSTKGENTISGGLVVRDSDQNEFVWIPVPNISKMAVLQDGSSSNYRGVLYNWDDPTGQTTYSWSVNSTDWREPANLGTTSIVTEYVTVDSQEMFTRYGGGTYTDTMYQTEFNSMVESVGKYKGFYVGRYETGGFNTNKIVVKAGETGTTNRNSADNSINNATWYKMYQMQKDYASGNESVASTMIWGCQWDQVMKFIDEKEDGAGNTFDVTLASETRHTRKLGATGSNINDKVQNIYDLEGNLFEKTLEAYNTDCRIGRGGYYLSTIFFSAIRSVGSNFSCEQQIGSRISLYIE